jgi:copper(I)-binding protein
MKKNIILMILLLLSGSVFAETKFPEIKNQWLRAAPPGAMMLAAYLELTNTEPQDKVLIGAFSPDFKLAEIHETVIKQGIAKMVHQPELIIQANQKILFKPGGLHIMLMQPKQQFIEGDEVKICLIWKKDGKTSVQHIMFPVLKK